MSALICGSFAYDTIMVFPDQFKNHILPDKVHMLNVAFLVPNLRREFGGCAGNIAYNLKLLGDEPVPMGTVGSDFTSYATWMDKHDISRRHVHVKKDSYTAQAFITTDMDDNQITAFHPGAMNLAHETHISEAKDIRMSNRGVSIDRLPSARASNLSTDLSDDHPVGITYDASQDPTGFVSKTGNPSSYPDRLLSEGMYVECISCHNPHDDTYSDFLVESNANSNLCTRCHTK